MYSTLLWYAHDVRSQLVIVVFVAVLVLCDLQCLVLVAIATIIYGGRTLNTIIVTNREIVWSHQHTITCTFREMIDVGKIDKDYS